MQRSLTQFLFPAAVAVMMSTGIAMGATSHAAPQPERDTLSPAPVPSWAILGGHDFVVGEPGDDLHGIFGEPCDWWLASEDARKAAADDA